MNRYKNSIITAVCWSIYQSVGFGTADLTQIILNLGFQYLSFEIVHLINFTVRLLPYFVFEILYGTVIYKHFCTASVYYFSRCPNRRKWFFRETLAFLPIPFSFTILLVLPNAILVGHKLMITPESLILMLYFVLIHSLWLYFMTICINLLAIKLNSSRGFSFAAALQLFFIAITSFYEKLPFNEDAFYVPILIIINPISHLILGWHSSSINNVDNLIDSLGIQFDLNLSLVVLLLSNLALLYVGMKVVDKQELIITNAETGGN